MYSGMIFISGGLFGLLWSQRATGAIDPRYESAALILQFAMIFFGFCCSVAQSIDKVVK